MNKASFSFLWAILMLVLWVPQTGSAKSPTIRITIAGGGLAEPIEVTDHRILDIAGWGGPSADALATEPSQDRPYYEVSFYSEVAQNDVRKNYFIYYYPNPSNGRGVIYLPGKGVVWELNVGTILRKGEDGKWLYAPRVWDVAWDATVRPALARAKAAAARPKTLITIDSWTRPRPGWLYILDPRSEPNLSGSRIWLLDPETANVMGSVRAGYEPDFALSPDGSHLYIASGERESGELAVIDTATGNLRHVPFADRVLYNPWYQGLPPFSGMTIASDGRVLWIPEQHVFSPDRIESQLSAFDTRSEGFLSKKVDLGNCGYGDFVPSSAANQFDFLCGEFVADSNRVHFVRLNSEHREVSNTFADLPWSKRCGLAEGFLSSSGSTMAVIRNDGAIYEMDTATQKFSPTAVTGNCREWKIAHVPWPRSADGAKVYLGYGGVAPDGMSAATELRAFDTATWKQLGRVQTSVPFWSAVAGRDGKHLYAVAPAQHSVLVIDAVTLQERRAINVGNTPSLVIIAP